MEAGAGTAGGSLIGMLVGVLGGPVGMLLGAGAASGALYDADRLDKGDEAIEQFGALVPTGGNALLAETVEDTTGPLDAFAFPEGDFRPWRCGSVLLIVDRTRLPITSGGDHAHSFGKAVGVDGRAVAAGEGGRGPRGGRPY